MTTWREVDASALILAATDLIWAARLADDDAARAAVAHATAAHGEDAITALAYLLAEMVPDDVPPATLRAWTENREAYRRLREHGLTADAARNALPLIKQD